MNPAVVREKCQSLGGLSRFPDYPGKPGTVVGHLEAAEQDDGVMSRETPEPQRPPNSQGWSDVGNKITTQY